jgi:hypothetical protein
MKESEDINFIQLAEGDTSDTRFPVPPIPEPQIDQKNLPRLTIKQDKAVKHFFLHGNKADAYRHAYSTRKMSQSSVQREALRLFENPTITPWLDHYQEKKEEEFSLSITHKKQMLLAAAEKGLKDKGDAHGNMVAHNLAGTVAAISELNRMEGDHAPIKNAFTGTHGEAIDISGAAVSLNAKLARLAAGEKKKPISSKFDGCRGSES